MKRKCGRPRGKTYPEPDTISKAVDTAIYGKIGASEAMALLRDSPFETLDYIKRKPPKKRNAVDREYLRRAPEFIERWWRRAGQTLCEKIASRDVGFFRDLADSLEELSNDAPSIDSVRRLIAAEYKLFCEARNLPFTSGGLREYYGRRNPGDIIDSSTLSKMVRWARPARPSGGG
jgi:hypothetical protein